MMGVEQARGGYYITGVPSNTQLDRRHETTTNRKSVKN